MNPNFMGNISHQQIQNNLSMMNPEMNKSTSNMISGMSDSELQDYLSQIGMSGVNPSKFRSMCQNMSNMNDSQFNSMENMSQDNIKKVNYNNYNNKSGIVQFITNMKEEGNSLFRNGKYKKAIEKYYDTIEKICIVNDKEKYKAELDNIENICRLNIANCKLKTGDYDGVINECSIVLESSKCFKGYYRMGLALMKKNIFDKAYRYLDNANEIGTASEKKAVEPYLKECKEKLEEIKKKQREERLKKENEENQKQKEEQKNNSEPDKQEKKENNNRFNTLRNIIKKEKIKNIIKNAKENGEDDDIKVEDGNKVKVSNNNKKYNIKIYSESCNYCHPNNNSNNLNNIDNKNPNMSQNNMNKEKDQINNMSDEQLNLLVKQMKSMDDRTLKSMMAAQGMTLSDQQIEMMKISMTPETLKMMRNQNFQKFNIKNINSKLNNNQTSHVQNNNSTNMPNLTNMDIQQMIDFMKKNPELFKMLSPQLSNIMGGGDTPPEIMMESMEKIFRIFNFLEQIINFLLSWKGACFIILIIAIIYALFKKINQ